ncbi:hypothetical protein DITRI_Ditri06bG0155600 [Diplodiscus trichospermus]
MAGNGYTYRGHYTTYNGVALQTDGWSKTSYTSDHMSQAVIIDAEGRRKPVMSYAPNGNSESYVVKTEIVERVPLVTGYKQKDEVIGDYSPEKWDKSSSHVRYHVNTSSSDQGDLSDKEWQKPRGNSTRNEKPDYPYKRDSFLEPTMTTTGGARTNPSHGAWSTEKGAKLSEPTSDISTTRGIDSSEAARKYGGAVINNRTRSIDSGEAATKYGGAIIKDRTRSIDSGEAARKYGGITNSDLAFRPMDNYTEIIDNKEVARKYGGTAAFNLFLEMVLCGVRPSAIAMVSLVQACEGMRNLELGKCDHGSVLGFGTGSDVLVLSAQINL